MQAAKQEDGSPGPADVRFMDIMILLAKRKRLIFGLPLIMGLCATLISVALPNIYQANAKLLPPQQAQSGAQAMLAQLGGAAGIAASLGGIKNPNEMYIGMLKSRTIADRMIARFDLKKVYDLDLLEKTRKELASNSTFTTGKDGLINIEVEDENPQRVAEMANAYVEELSRLTTVLAVTEASQRRMFFERQLALAKNNLAEAEASLKGTISTRGVISVEGETRAIVETIARLRAQIAVKEIQFGAMQAFVTPGNQEYKRIQQEIASMRAELSKLENGSPSEASASESRPKPVGLENIKVLRDVKYQQMLYELLAKQFELARLDESKDVSIIQVLDKAVAPERKVRPIRSLIVALSTLLGVFMAIIWVIAAAQLQKLVATWRGNVPSPD